MRVHLLSLALLLGAVGAARAQQACMDQIKFPEVGPIATPQLAVLLWFI